MTDVNVPEAFPGAGLSGQRLSVNPAKAAQRRADMAAAISGGYSNEEIEHIMRSTHGLTEFETEQLREQVAERMLRESEDRKPYKKAMAEKRLHSHINKAAKRQAWGAVANLEGQLARIQGTEEPLEQKVSIDARMQSATLHVLGELTEEQIQAMVADEMALLEG